MEVQKIIITFSQSEKIKSGLIWVSQALQLLNGLQETEKRGAETVAKAILDMIVHEIQLGKNASGDVSWDVVLRHIDKAMVMINSGVAVEAVVHLTQGLSQVTSIGHRSMSFLKEKGFL
jgi:hypothetical protein